MKKIGLIALREFLAAVVNRGFLIGLLMMPLLGGILILVGPYLGPALFNPRVPAVRGQIVLLDPTSQVGAELRFTLDPMTLAAERAARARTVMADAPEAVRVAASNQVLETVAGSQPELRVVEHPASSDLQKEKEWLTDDPPEDRHLAVVVIHHDAIVAATAGAALGGYDLYVPMNLDVRVEDVIHEGVQEAIVRARVRAEKMDRDRVDALMRVPRASSVTVTKGDERRTASGFNVVLPIVLAALLVFGVMIGGQTLLTSMVEEKSSRVIEVLLSAVSPLELMTGKILGQLAVSLLVLTVYLGLGGLVLISLALTGLLDPWLVVYLLVFFLITYALFGAVFAAAGAAVNDMKEAQALMGPVMLVLMGPWMLAFPISRNPDSTLALVLSFVPPVNTFAMMMRLASSAPPPLWQTLLSIAIGIGAACAAIWFAAKVFRIGLLMSGKAPNIRTLVRWVRAA